MWWVLPSFVNWLTRHFFIVVVSAVLVAVVFRPCDIVLWGRQWVAGGVEGDLLKGIQVDGDRI